MDYEFGRDITGAYQALFSMGHEALGVWLTDEIGTDRHRLDRVISETERLLQRQGWEWSQEGLSYSLFLSRDEASVRANALGQPQDMEIDDEDMDFYDDESQASCGLDDFYKVLQDWAEFTA
ncbi:YacL family protein [Marinobacterium jannaschii]|uniref:UPF0231 family protein n=1 Tax=Marinobacterium jannaschii TaxID=64970 RepID=UPI000481E22C|nr:YacL family protein [Marinobacterium jannaschii]